MKACCSVVVVAAGLRFNGQPEQRRVFVVLNDGHDSLNDCAVRRCLVFFSFGRSTNPTARGGIDSKAEKALFLTPPESLVYSADCCPRRVVNSKDGPVFVLRNRGSYVQSTFTARPRKDSLDLEALALSVFIVGGDSLRWFGFNVVDPNDVSDGIDATHVRVTDVTAFGFGIMCGPTLLANE